MIRTLWLTALVAAIALAAAGCGSGSRASRGDATSQVHELQSIGQLREQFDAHPGVPRLIVLVSPT